MKIIRRRMIATIALMLVLLLSACITGAKKYELTNHVGKSVSSFQRRSGVKLEKQSNGVYVKKGVLQVIAPEKKVTSVTLLKKAGKYKVCKVGIGMTKKAADQLLGDTFGKETSKTINSSNNYITYSYLKDNKELYISYDIDKQTVAELSYYKVDKSEQKAVTTSEPENTGELMVIVGKNKVYYNEAMVYLKSVQENYETDYGKNIWKADILGNGVTFGKMVKEEVVNQITELKVIRAKAEELKVTLTEEEKSEAATYASEHYKGLTKEDRQRYMITEELLQQVYCDNLLADKVFENVTINVDTNVSDEAAKQITVQDIFIQNYNLNSEGKKITLSDEDQKEAYKKVKALLEQAKDTQDFKSLAEANSEADTIEYTFGSGKGPKDYGDTFEKAAFALKTGQVSSIITMDNGWHIVYCVSDFNEDATTQVKEDIIEERRNDMFSKSYKEWSADYDVVVNNEAWDAITLED